MPSFSGTFNLNGHTMTFENDLTFNSGVFSFGGGKLHLLGNLICSKDIDLAGGNMEVDGNVYQTSGTISINKGNLSVKGDLLQYRTSVNSVTNETEYYSGGSINMGNVLDRVSIDGKWVTYGSNTLTAGTLTLGGNLEQHGNSASFKAGQYHKTILNSDSSPTNKQKVSFENTNNYFYTLELINPRNCYSFNPDNCWKVLSYAEPTELSLVSVTVTDSLHKYDGKAHTLQFSITIDNKELKEDTDYTVSYKDNINAGTASAIITGKGRYTGTITKTFTISKADPELAFAESVVTKKFTDTAFTIALTKTTDGSVAFKSNDTKVATVNSTSGLVTIKGAGTATITATASEGQNYKAGRAEYTLTVEAPAPTPTPAVTGFSDVQDPTHPYYKAIYWAADAGITKGYSDGSFGVNKSCTRGEMIMFLWRYAGKPAPKTVSKSPFKDVSKTHAFYKAVLWAYQTGVTKGYSDGMFGVNRNVSRGESMMFLWRLKGKPAPKAVAKAPFPDVPKSHVFYNAVLWGYQKKITTGFTSGSLKGKFGVNENCSRGQIVTFLYRAK